MIYVLRNKETQTYLSELVRETHAMDGIAVIYHKDVSKARLLHNKKEIDKTLSLLSVRQRSRVELVPYTDAIDKNRRRA